MKPRLILASASPRRRRLLEEAGYELEVDPSGIEEPPPEPGASPAEYAALLAWRKAAEVARRRGAGLILAADTVCVVAEEILNKPVDRADAERMIRLQEGRDTDVISGLCLFHAGRQEWLGAIETSVVRFRPLARQEREHYLDSLRWQGKSGAYGVQDCDPFVSVVRGSFSNVVGLPMERLASLLEQYPHLLCGERSVASREWFNGPARGACLLHLKES
jgi:septum formation protein